MNKYKLLLITIFLVMTLSLTVEILNIDSENNISADRSSISFPYIIRKITMCHPPYCDV